MFLMRFIQLKGVNEYKIKVLFALLVASTSFEYIGYFCDLILYTSESFKHQLLLITFWDF